MDLDSLREFCWRGPQSIDTKAKVEGFKSKRNVKKNKQDIIQIAAQTVTIHKIKMNTLI